MILITGLAHTYSSAVTKFLSDNGAVLPDSDEGYGESTPYNHYESNTIYKWGEDMKHLKSTPFPLMDGIFKAANVSLFLDKIPEEVKIIYCHRNIVDLVESYSKRYKGKHPTMKLIDDYYHSYNCAVLARQNIYFLITERLINGDKNEAARLLDFCDLHPKEITFDLMPQENRKLNYFRYRGLNLLIKLLSAINTFPKQDERRIPSHH